MLKTETRTIGELEVGVTQFAGRRNLSVLVDLAKVAGPTIAAATSGTGGDMMNAEIDIEKVVTSLVGSMDKASVTKLIDDLLASTSVNGRALDHAEFDRVFAGPDLWTLPKVLGFVIEVNFGNFSALAESVSGVVGQKATAQTSAS